MVIGFNSRRAPGRGELCRNGVYYSGNRIDSDTRYYPEKKLAGLLGQMHIGVPLIASVLRQTVL